MSKLHRSQSFPFSRGSLSHQKGGPSEVKKPMKTLGPRGSLSARAWHACACLFVCRGGLLGGGGGGVGGVQPSIHQPPLWVSIDQRVGAQPWACPLGPCLFLSIVG